MLKLSSAFLGVWATLTLRVDAFAGTGAKTFSSSTTLYISSWGTKGPPAFRQASRMDPEKRIQDYLPEPGAVEARANIDGTILVSGLVSPSPSGTSDKDQFLFDLLNHEDSAFEFSKITAFVSDAAFAKKRLLSRSARYTGLLDKLDFVQAAEGTLLPTVAQLEGCKSWLAVVDQIGGSLVSHCHDVIATAVQAPSLENVAILLTGANELDAAQCQALVDKLSAGASTEEPKKQYTIVAVGQLEERPEGSTAFAYDTFGTPQGVLPAKSVFAREEAYRMITELLQLECGVNQALSFAEVYNVNATESKLIKGLREAGYARPQEIDHMIRLGPKAYKEAIEKFRTENPDAALGYTTNAWWEADEFKLSRQRSDERMAATAQAVKDARTIEIEAVAKEWAKREYFRASMAGTVENDMTEEEYTQSVWERAMFEGDLKYRISKGEAVDESSELANFQSRQERKQQVMLQRAKAELSEILQEDLNDDLVLPASKKGKPEDDDDE